MTVNAATVLERLSAQGVQVTPRPNGNLWLEPASKIPPDLLEAVRENKPAILALLPRPRLAEGSPGWHAEEIARCVMEEGVCVFWSELLGETIAFVKDESCRATVPAKIVAYTCQELRRLFDQNADDATLRLIHEAKKRGGVVK